VIGGIQCSHTRHKASQPQPKDNNLTPSHKERKEMPFTVTITTSSQNEKKSGDIYTKPQKDTDSLPQKSQKTQESHTW
jgi:hypothetical protein